MDSLIKRIIIFLLLFCFACSGNMAQAASKEKLVKKGNTLFFSGDYDEAINAYDEAAVDHPESPYIYYNKGTALYKKEDYKSAIDAFGQAAIKSKDLVLESKSKFNLGVCFFREGERQKDSDLNKTLASYGLSVQSFQEALDIDPEFVEAAENIELVRLIMKSVLDEIKKQEEEARKQQEQAQKIAEEIKKLIDKQDSLLTESRSLLTDRKSPKESSDSTDEFSKQNHNMADAQNQLKQETQYLSQQLSVQQSPGAVPPTQPQQEHPSQKHLQDSTAAQKKAVQNLSENDLQTGTYQQEASLEALNKALDALKSDQNQQKGQQQNQQQQQSAQQDQKNCDQNNQKDNKEETQAAEKEDQKENSGQDDQQTQAMQLTDNADSILNEEKENKKQRIPYSPGGFKEVDKDW